MVGFGSSLRMGRRAGWEPAYMDYETLKLFLSQIESVYEEEGHHINHRTRDVFMGEPDAEDQTHQHKRNKTGKDYRDELFLESDSDAAFASSQSSGRENSSDDTDYDYDKTQQHNHRGESGRPLMVPTMMQGSAKPFTLMSSHYAGASSSEDSNSSADEASKCGGVPWRTEKSPALKSQRKRNKSAKKNRYQGEDGDYFVRRETAGLDTFIMDEGSESFEPNSKNSYTSSLFNAPFQLGVSSENASLLAQPNTSQNEAFVSFSQALTPPKETYGTSASYHHEGMMHPYGGSVNAFISAQKISSPAPTPKVAKLEKERRRARRQRRRRKLARKRRDREKKVPQHIRVAHSKARAITERFLGLLRAEVEKITLFTQARLGELADTAGSLRFLSSEELTEFSETFAARATSSTYEHPLSDGGIHASASSSSDDGGGGQGIFPWSDSSSDGEASKGSGRLNIPNNFSSSGVSTQTEQRTKLTSRGDISRGVSSVKPEYNKQKELYEATRRKIDHFKEIRRERPIFQRNDHIVGEDLLLVSAVDEADAYSAVGVELMHILKYICVNVIAVRKICRKHDRLLMNRMLGGYYHRKRTTRAREERTLGGLIAHVASDIYEAHPALIGLVNHGKIVGVYDLKIQQLSNSRTVKVISSCLALSLSEYEVSRTRADALAQLNSSSKATGVTRRTEAPSSLETFDLRAVAWAKSATDTLVSPCRDGEVASFGSDDDKGSGPPSTASSMSLARLRFTVLSIAALREASRFKSDSFATYLGRSTLSFTGHAVVGEGLDGCSRETLEFLVSYSPDAALLLDASALYEGLRRGRWRQLSIGSVMRSSLAVALTTSFLRPATPVKMFYEEEFTVMNALSILPKSEGIDSFGPLDDRALPLTTSLSISRFMDFPPALLRANRFSLFLYTANYYIVHPTASTFVLAAGANVAYSAAIIGSATFSAMISAALHCYVLSSYSSSSKLPNFNFAPFRRLLLLSSIAAIIGNVIHAHGISQTSIPISVLGRLFLGLGSADIVHRQFVITFIPPSLIVAESARLVQFQVLGLITGLFLGSLNELMPFQSKQYGGRSIQISNWLMVALWIIQFSRLLCGGRNPGNPRTKVYQTMESAEIDQVDYSALAGNSSDSSVSDTAPGPARLFHRSPPRRELDAPTTPDDKLVSDVPPTRVLRRTDTNGTRRRRFKFGTFVKRIRRIMAYNVAIPVTLALVVYTIFAQEVLFTSCALIADRYFGWRGNIAGFFLACLSILILPIDFVCEQVARRYEERTTIKRAIMLLGIGLLVMVNWGSIFALAANVRILLTETKNMRHHYYDWLLGIPQYVIGFIITFLGLKAVHSASRSLLSKVSPAHVKSVVTSIGTIVTFLGLLAQLLADVHILGVGLSHRLINTDIVNALVVPMLIACLVAYYFVRKHFFFLM